jgi:alkylation response protein AidB-like acyl-CoA dehydrogenase
MGVLTMLVPEEHDGLGLDETWLVPILEEAGRVALPHPLVETAMVAAPLAAGSGPIGMVTSTLGGPHAPCASDADGVLVDVDGSLAIIGPELLTLGPVDTVDGARRAATVALPAGGSFHHAESDDPAALALALDRGALGTAAVLVGLGQAMLDLTVTYVKERQQFGVPVGSFQAVKHHLAEAALALEFARPAVLRAAWSTAHGAPTRARDVSMAKAMASDAAELVGRQALQCHGAIGYTVEADLQLFL